MCDHPQEPWFFHRDELTLLEDGFDDLFQIHEQSKPGVVKTMEASVLNEHLSVEEEFERAIAERMGANAPSPHEGKLPPPPAPPAPHEGDVPEFFAALDPAGDPFYRQALSWSRRVVAWAHKAYFAQARRDRDVYRVLVNAHLVPIKIANVCEESMADDEIAREISEKELELAGLYLGRAVGSMKVLRLAGTLSMGQAAFVQEASEIDREIARRLTLFKRGNPGSL